MKTSGNFFPNVLRKGDTGTILVDYALKQAPSLLMNTSVLGHPSITKTLVTHVYLFINRNRECG